MVAMKRGFRGGCWSDEDITADKISASSLYFNEIPPPANVYANVKVEDLYGGV